MSRVTVNCKRITVNTVFNFNNFPVTFNSVSNPDPVANKMARKLDDDPQLFKYASIGT